MRDFNVNGSVNNALRSIKPCRGTNPDQFDDWYKKSCFIRSISLPDTFCILEGASQTDQHHDIGGDGYTTSICRAAPGRV